MKRHNPLSIIKKAVTRVDNQPDPIPLPDNLHYDSIADFLVSREGWLRVEVIDRGKGSFDFAIIIDGTYTKHSDDDGVDYKTDLLECFTMQLEYMLQQAGLTSPKNRSKHHLKNLLEAYNREPWK